MHLIMNNIFDDIGKSINTWGQNLGLIQKPMISPLPEQMTLDTPVKMYRAQDNLQRTERARMNPTPASNSAGLQYPDWMANAPSPKAMNALKTIRRVNPALKMGDAEILKFYDQYGDRLLDGLVTSKVADNPVTPTPIPQKPGLSMKPAVLGTNTIQPRVQGQPAPEVLEFLNNTVLPITRNLNIPDPVAAGQFAGEGRLQGAGAQRNNYFNIGFTDTHANTGNYHGVPQYQTPEAGVEAYARFITGQADDNMYANGVDGSKQGKIGKLQLQQIYQKYKNDPQKYLQAIAPMYSSLGSEYANRIMQTPEWRYFRQ